jgi:hypothetical protein
VSPPRQLLACLAVLAAAGCGGGADDVPPAAEPAATTTEPEATASVSYEYHDEFGHGHCSVTELADGGEVVVCLAPTDRGTRIACFTREEAASSRNAMGLIRLNRAGEVAEQEEWPAECAEALEVVDPVAGSAAGSSGGY